MISYKIFLKMCKIFNFLFLSMLIFVYGFLANGFIEKQIVRNEIENFKNRGMYVETVTINMKQVNMYKVVKEYDYEDVSRSIYQFDFATREYFLGSKTDITITSRNPMRYSASKLIRNICGFFANQFYLGHATINVSEDGSYYVESVGNELGDGVYLSYNTWINTEISGKDSDNRIVGLRIKNTTEEQRDQICNDAIDKVGCAYNFNFFIPYKDKYYCTDLVTRVLYKNGIDLNYDNLFSIGNDLIISDDTYLIYYIECDDNGVFNFYYLSEE